MKLGAILLCLALLAAMASASGFPNVRQSDCQTDDQCERCQVHKFPTNKCLQSAVPTTYVLVNCTEDGTAMHQYLFGQPLCEGPVRHVARVRTDVCSRLQNGLHAQWSCLKGFALEDVEKPQLDGPVLMKP